MVSLVYHFPTFLRVLLTVHVLRTYVCQIVDEKRHKYIELFEGNVMLLLLLLLILARTSDVPLSSLLPTLEIFKSC